MEIKEIAEYYIKQHSKGNVIVEEDRVLVANIGRYLPNVYRVFDKENFDAQYIGYFDKTPKDDITSKYFKETVFENKVY